MEKIIRKKEDIVRSIQVDYWLWDYTRWRINFREKRRRLENPEKIKLKYRLAMRRWRKRRRAESREKLIKMVYWHEVNHPEIPLRAYDA